MPSALLSLAHSLPLMFTRYILGYFETSLYLVWSYSLHLRRILGRPGHTYPLVMDPQLLTVLNLLSFFHF